MSESYFSNIVGVCLATLSKQDFTTVLFQGMFFFFFGRVVSQNIFDRLLKKAHDLFSPALSLNCVLDIWIIEKRPFTC